MKNSQPTRRATAAKLLLLSILIFLQSAGRGGAAQLQDQPLLFPPRAPSAEAPTAFTPDSWARPAGYGNGPQPDGRKYATADAGGTVLVLNTPEMSIEARLGPHRGKITAMAFCEDGRRLLVGGPDDGAVLWNTTSGQLLFRLDHSAWDHFGDAHFDVAISRDGGLAVTAGYAEIVVWNLASGRRLHTLETGRNRGPIRISRAGTILASNWRDVALWDIKSGQRLRSFFESATIHSVDFAGDENLAVVGTDDGLVTCWDLATGKDLWRHATGFVGPSSPGIAVSPDGKKTAVVEASGEISILDSSSGKKSLSLPQGRSWILGLAFARDGRYLLGSSLDWTTTVWDLADGKKISSFSASSVLCGGNDSIGLCADGRHVITETDKRGAVWDLRSGALKGLMGMPGGRVKALQFSPDDTELWTGAKNLAFTRWSCRTGERLAVMPDEECEYQCVAISPGGDMVATCDGGQVVTVRDTKTGQPICTMDTSRNALIDPKIVWNNAIAMAFCPDREHLLVPGYSPHSGGVVGIRSLRSGLLLRAFGEPHQRSFERIALSMDGKVVIAASKEGRIATWDVGSGRLLRTLEAPPDKRQSDNEESDEEPSDPVCAVAISDHGEKAAAVTESGAVTLWDLDTGRKIPAGIGRPPKPVGDVRFSPDAQTVALALPHSIGLWDLTSGEKVTELKMDGWPISVLAYSHDGNLLAAGSEDGAAALWKLNLKKRVEKGTLAGSGRKAEDEVKTAEAKTGEAKTATHPESAADKLAAAPSGPALPPTDAASAEAAKAACEKGDECLQKMDFDGAISTFTAAIRLDPRNAEAYSKRALAFDKTYKRDEAIADLSEAIRLDPKDAKKYKARGDAYKNWREADDAIADYTAAICLDPKLAAAYYGRGSGFLQLLRLGDRDRAIADFSEAIRLDPNCAAAYIERGLCYGWNHDHDKELADLTEAIRIDPKADVAYHDRAMVYLFNRREYDKAIADFTEAIRLDPTPFASSYYFRGTAYSEKGEYDKAIADFTAVIALRPEDDDAYWDRGLAYSKKGEKAKAEEDFAQAKTLGHKEK